MSNPNAGDKNLNASAPYNSGQSGEHSQNGKSNNSFFRQPDRPSLSITPIKQWIKKNDYIVYIWITFLLFSFLTLFYLECPEVPARTLNKQELYTVYFLWYCLLGAVILNTVAWLWCNKKSEV